MSEEQNLTIRTIGQYKNIDLRELEPDNYVIVEKIFAEGYEFESKKFKNRDGTPAKFYSCKVRYGGEEVTFLLNERYHDAFKVVGGIGDKIKITAFEEKVKLPSGTLLVKRFKFDKV